MRMRITTKALALAALVFAVAFPATAASAACDTSPYCNPDTPNAGGSDSGRTGGGDFDTTIDRSDPEGDSGGGSVGDVEGEESTGGAGEVLPESSVDSGGEPAGVASAGVETERSAPSGTLPLTGGDVVQLAVIGAGAIGLGALLVRRSRASQPAA